MLRALLEAGANAGWAKDDGTTPIFISSQNGHLEVVHTLLEAADVDVNQAEDGGATPLAIAAHQGHFEVVRALVEAGADQSTQTPWGTALAIAGRMGHKDVVDLLA